ncbi:iron-containing alcohol dehydrogenase [Mesorhizobium sp. LHD-90]|uniref:iron-containing alcohol dehydrogenase n=1 Tax=Mesorhizobium sp. LHD-90 TaxID=3071414 RepID=UPI0027DF9F59|nr:iron-containing alcohol dehydrogenase [Mesorhizobium sp. LHD-90]MDQ6435339.1 iron-containing alcohol dehydrogenase [Mesorhizobium sp. LHD-90]
MDGAKKIERLLAGTYVDRDTGKAIGVATKSLVIKPSLAGMEGDLVAALGFGKKVAVVSDRTTHAVLGKRVEQALDGRHAVQSIVFPEPPYPDDASAEKIRRETAGADAIVAVGSGTINDVCKYASAQDRKPYAVFATAPSMNGYTSVNAAITQHGHKMSLPAQAPAGAFFDLAVLSAAPARLIRAGLGDSLCRTTAEADWLLAHLLHGLPFRELPYELLEDDEGPLFDNAAALMAGDLEVMERLVNTLVLAGFGTAIVGNSQPASQGEHLISHYIDMFADGNRPLIYHGEQVGVTTLSMVRLQERMLDETPVIWPDTETEAGFKARYGDELGASCWAEFQGKRIDTRKAEALNARLAERWHDMRERIAGVLLKSSYLTGVLKAAGADLTPEAIHLPRKFYDGALLRCREIRNRYTFLDLAANAGRLEGAISAI